MGLFDKRKCDICGNEKGPLFTFKLEGGIVCDECHDKLSKKKFLKGYSLDDAKKELENISEEKEKLKAVVAEKKEKLSNEPITRYCTKCGQKFSGNFCPNCGTPVNNTATNNVTPASIPSIACPKCGSDNISIQFEEVGSKTKKKKNSIVRSAARGGAIVATGGLWALTPKHDGKEKTKNKLKKFAVCQNCGNSWKVK
nr:MAG TPA: protein of unknown function DUF4428 [Caudoviricetes sp.]